MAKISASSRMTIIPSWLMSSSRPTNGEMSDAPALAASRPWLVVKINVQLVLMPSSAKRLIASRPFSRHRDLDHDVRGELREVPALLEHPIDVVGDDLGRDRARGDLADLLEDLVVRAADLGVEGRVGGHAIEDAPAGDGLDLFDVGGVQEDLHQVVLQGGSVGFG